MVGALTQVLDFISKQGVKLTLSADNIYEENETLVLGLLWILILKFQVGKKEEILSWLRELLEIDIANFDSDWRDGKRFAKLVSALTQTNEEYDKSDSENAIRSRLTYAFEVADQKLGIKQLLTAEDVISGFLDERSNLTYLSFFYNVRFIYFFLNL